MPSDGPLRDSAFFEQGAALLAALADRDRLLILRILLTRDLSLNSLALITGIGAIACSKHLGALRGAGLVACIRRADTDYFSCRSDHVRKVLETLDDILPGASAERPPECGGSGAA
ncbi:helix-turn-helix domain-containing protein [Rhizobium tumorigenes]|uniref:Helix-turn-helix domain-containing protein n=1 Tax=Rhizobium tumorigenes TaxID=2041385 RepID=A0AAF1K2M1_9HYPH|nr:helix-turn-helix domain-containing protein [Rhizobium tumorigenes]WFR94130.1 helix-turn-helix domain-containing protein [Rhizobium tumorigenes]